jgi:hypothetical protein
MHVDKPHDSGWLYVGFRYVELQEPEHERRGGVIRGELAYGPSRSFVFCCSLT